MRISRNEVVKDTRKRLQELYGKEDHPLKRQRAAYSAQKRTAKQRGIEWKFTFAEWWAWWQIDNRWANRGMGGSKLVMARHGDAGPYNPENVYCATHSQNISDRKGRGLWGRPVSSKAMEVFKRRGAERHNSRPVITPAGTFASATLAAEHFGFSRQRAAQLAREGRNGWRWADKDAA
jgi:hypothetical protein